MNLYLFKNIGIGLTLTLCPTSQWTGCKDVIVIKTFTLHENTY